tara:strand:- start:2365 stop:2730 length:366 start_codon:yes stop_codon:yes gene_type:complete
MYKIKVSKKDGRGLYATKDIPKGTVIFIAELIILNKEETAHMEKTVLKYYNFNYAEKRNCLVLGDGMLFNHQTPDNVSYKMIKKNKREVMQYKANRNIKKGEQLYIDYTKDEVIDLEAYMS